MANLTPTASWSDVPAWDETTLAKGDVMNAPAQSLLNRTELLQQEKADKSDIVQGQYSFATMAEFNAVKATIPAHSTVIIDEVGTNQGTNTWNGTTLTKSPYDPYTRAISYSDSLVTSSLDTIESPYDSLSMYVSSGLKLAGDISVNGGSSTAVSNYTYVLNKNVASKKIKAVVIQSSAIGSKVTLKAFTKGSDRFAISRTLLTLTIYKDGFNYFVIPADREIVLTSSEHIGFSTTSANLKYKLVTATTQPMYYNANSASATEVLLSSEGKTAEIQIGFFSEAKTGIITNYVSTLLDDFANLKSDIYDTSLVGKKSTPTATGNNANSAQWIPSNPLTSSGVLSKFSTYASASGSLDICVYTNIGSGSFTVRTSVTVAVVPGLNTFYLNIPVTAGEYLGIKTSIAGLTQYVASSDNTLTFPVYSHTSLSATTGFAGPTNGYIWQYNFEVLTKKAIDQLKKWKDKKYVSFGDSITWYNGQTFASSHIESGQLVKGYQSYIVDELGCTLDNKGQSGWDMTQINTSMIQPYDFTGVYLTTITSGANDCRKGISVGTIQPIGGTFNTTTYAGAMQAAIEKVISSNPATKIILITPIRGWYNEYGTANVPNTDPTVVGLMKREYPDMVKAIGKLYGLPVIDFYDECELNDLNKSYFLGDNPAVFTAYLLHPMNRFFQRMGEIALKTLRNL